MSEQDTSIATEAEMLAAVERWARLRGLYPEEAKDGGWYCYRNVVGGMFIAIRRAHGQSRAEWAVSPALALAWAILVESEPPAVDAGSCPECVRRSPVGARKLTTVEWCQRFAWEDAWSRRSPGGGMSAREMARIQAETLMSEGWTVLELPQSSGEAYLPTQDRHIHQRARRPCPACSGTGRHTLPIPRLLLGGAAPCPTCNDTGMTGEQPDVSICPDCAPRQQLRTHADALQAAGDPRGELLALTLMWSIDPTSTAGLADVVRWLEWLTWAREFEQQRARSSMQVTGGTAAAVLGFAAPAAVRLIGLRGLDLRGFVNRNNRSVVTARINGERDAASLRAASRMRSIVQLYNDTDNTVTEMVVVGLTFHNIDMWWSVDVELSEIRRVDDTPGTWSSLRAHARRVTGDPHASVYTHESTPATVVVAIAHPQPSSAEPIVYMRAHWGQCLRCAERHADRSYSPTNYWRVWAPEGYEVRPCDIGPCPNCDKWSAPKVVQQRDDGVLTWDSALLRIGETVAWHDLADRELLEITRFEAHRVVGCRDWFFSKLFLDAFRRDLSFAVTEATYRNLLPTPDDLHVGFDLAWQQYGDVAEKLSFADLWCIAYDR